MTIIEDRQAVTGTNREFDTFFADRYRPMVALATSLVDQRCAAEEIVQDSLQQVWARWDTLEEPSCYLRTTVVNRCNDELRKRRVRRDAHRALVRYPPAEADYLTDALADVVPRRRQALVLRFYGGHSLSEVAEVMNIPMGTAKSLIHRGLADMRLAID